MHVDSIIITLYLDYTCTPPGRNIEARCCKLKLSPLSYWLKDVQLTEQDKIALLQGAQLTDKHMNGCGLLMSKQFPELPKPQSTLYVQQLSKLQPARELSLFFHCYSSHWVLSYTLKRGTYTSTTHFNVRLSTPT